MNSKTLKMYAEKKILILNKGRIDMFRSNTTDWESSFS